MNTDQKVVVYLCSQYQNRHWLRTMRYGLERVGLSVQARWIDTDDADVRSMSDAERQAIITMDLDDLTTSDVVVAFSLPEQHGWGTGGRHVELGYAMAVGKPIVLVGKHENLFHYDRRVTVVPLQCERIASACIASVARRECVL